MDVADLLADPTKVADIAIDELATVLLALAAERDRVAGLERVLLSRLLSERPGDRLLKTEEAATRLGVAVNWLRHHRELPFVVRPSAGVVRYSSRGIDEWIAARRGKGY
jgi:hypothetical protein